MSMSLEELKEKVNTIYKNGKQADVLENDSEIIEFLLDNCELSYTKESQFFANINCPALANESSYRRAVDIFYDVRNAKLSEAEEIGAYHGAYDFGHTSTEWDHVISLGIFGLRERILNYKAKNPTKAKFYDDVLRCYDAALRFIKRAADEAKKAGKEKTAEGLYNLSVAPPKNLFEALQTSIIYYNLQHFFDGTAVRSLGRIDNLFYPYFIKEERTYAEDLLISFMKEINELKAPANMPFALCGTDENGNDTTNELSYLWLDTYAKAQVSRVKIHILCSKKTPRDIIEKAFRHIRNGDNSIVFMSDERVIESLMKIGAEEKDARRYEVIGCYEPAARGELPCSSSARLCMPRALELALTGGIDMQTKKAIGLEHNCKFETYEELENEFNRQLDHLINCAIEITNLWERNQDKLHASPFLSGVFTSSLEKGEDLYRDCAAKYNNSSLNLVGLATVADSLYAIKKAVYEDKIMSIGEFIEMLKNNWEGHEALRLLIKNKYPKYGQNNDEVDKIAQKVIEMATDKVWNKPNVKGGKWRVGIISITWRWEQGRRTGASADGRLSGEVLSQNADATFGADKEGTTAHILSVGKLDTSKTPNGTILDIDFHSSAVQGENGLNSMVASLLTYFELGGFAVHYNVLDTSVLIDAQKNPEKYPNLQVRVCGWNVLFSRLSEKEQNEFIARSIG